jgi:hypothetical protein
MHTSSMLAWAAVFTLQGIALVLWAMPCGVLAIRGKSEGIEFRKTFLVSFFMTPLAGIVMILMVRANRAHQRTSHHTSSNSAAASVRTSS